MTNLPTLSPQHDFSTNCESAELSVYLPLVDPSSLEVSIDQGRIRISARKNLPSVPNWPTCRIHAYSRDYLLELSLPPEIEAASAEAHLEEERLLIRFRRTGSHGPEWASVA